MSTSTMLRGWVAAQLKQLPEHQLKIDRSFVMDMLCDASDADMVRASVDIARQP